MGKISNDHVAVYRENIANIDSRLKEQANLFVGFLNQKRSEMRQLENENVASSSLWDEIRKRADVAFSDEYLVLFPELNSIMLSVADGATSWVSLIESGYEHGDLPEGWTYLLFPHDFPVQFEVLDAINADLEAFVDGSYYE